MRYTLWSRGRLLGETDLGFVYRENGRRTGWLYPNDLGERLLPQATGVAPSMRIEWILGGDETASADILSAVDHAEALALELRRSDGTVIETETIGIIDTDYLLSLPVADFDEDIALDGELLDQIDEWEAEWATDEIVSANEPETDWPRYQIQVHLVDPADVP